MAADGGAGNAPSWLFSFVDLAFLMVIAMTQLANPGALDLGEIIVPRIAEEVTQEIPAGSSERWQLRIHPPEAGVSGAPFELVRAGAEANAELRIDVDTLRERLVALEEGGGDKPALAPHEESRSRDLLGAVGVLEEVWPSRRRAIVERVVAQR